MDPDPGGQKTCGSGSPTLISWYLMLGDGPQAGKKGPEKAEHSTQVGLPDLPGPGYSHHGVVGAAGFRGLQPGHRVGNKKPTQITPKNPTKKTH
jgi:hypothetical protein